MPSQSLVQRANSIAVGAVTLPVSAVGYLATEPGVTGLALFALTRAPLQYRSRILKVLGDVGVSSEGIALLIKSLKVLLAYGAVKRLNQALNKLALNQYHFFGKPGAPFQWGGAKNELVVVTGGCSGFGYEMVKGFSKHARVICLDITPQPEEQKKLDGVHYYQIDLTDFDAIESVADTIRREHGDPSVLINNAGIATGTKVIESDAKKTDRIFKVNLTSHFILIKEFAPAMLRERKGHIVEIASMASFIAGPGLVDYCCTKIGALYLAEGLRAELRAYHTNGYCIQTSSVHPWWHRTGIVKPYEAKLDALGVKMDPPSNVADAVIEQVLAGRSGRIFVPKSQESAAGLRNLPLWMQDGFFRFNRLMRSFEF